MFRLYLKFAIRNLIKDYKVTTIKIVGLSAGLSLALLIGSWLVTEMSANKIFKNYATIGQIMENDSTEVSISTSSAVAIPLADKLRRDYSNIFQDVALVFPNFEHSVEAQGKIVSASGVWAEESFPSVLGLKLFSGQIHCLDDPSYVMISERLSKSLFGQKSSIAQTMTLDGKHLLKVGGVYQDFPANTRFAKTDLILPWKKARTVLSWLQNVENSWDSRFWWIFVNLKPGISFQNANSDIQEIIGESSGIQKRSLFLQPMSRWNLYDRFESGKESGGKINTIIAMILLTVTIVMVACINFMNLATAKNLKRGKEVGILKTIGATKKEIAKQFYFESLLVAILAMAIALLVAILLIQPFEEITSSAIELNSEWGWIVVGVLLITILVAFISGSYPSLYLSQLKPASVLKGQLKTSITSTLVRKILLVFQTTVCFAFFVSAMVMYQQIKLGKARNLGYEKNKLITVNLNSQRILAAPYNELRNTLINTGFVAEVAKSGSVITESPGERDDLQWLGSNGSAQKMAVIGVTHDFGNTIRWHVREGRDFSRDFPTDSGAVILNKAAENIIGRNGNIVGKKISFDGKSHEIKGVVDDIIMESPFSTVEPTLFYLNYDWCNTITIRLADNQPTGQAIDRVGQIFNAFNPNAAFVYSFISEKIEQKFTEESRLGKITLILGIMALFISGLGIFGLSAYYSEIRAKEISIRKVLGADVFSLWRLQAKEFVILVIIAGAVGTPISWVIMHSWLEQYNLRTNIPLRLFPLTFSLCLGTTLIVVSYEAVKIAKSKPAKNLQQ